MKKITDGLKLRALAEAPAGWYTNICPGCGEVIYTLGRDDGEQITHEPCKTSFVPIDMGELMYSSGEGKHTNMHGIRETIRATVGLDDEDMMGKTVTVSVCPTCGGYAWTFDGCSVTCAECKPDHMIIDSFVL